MIVINYHVPIAGTLKDALATAMDILLSTGMEPERIDVGDDGTAVSFDYAHAKDVRSGKMTERCYLEKHVVK